MNTLLLNMESIGKGIVALRWFRIPLTFGEVSTAEFTNDDDDDAEGHGGHVVQSARYNGFISSVQSLFTMTIVSAVLILSSFFCEKIDSFLTLSVIMGVGLIAMSYIYAFRKSFLTRRTLESKTDCERDNAALVGLVTFFILGSVHDVVHIASTAIHCGPVFKTCKELFAKQMIHVAYHVVTLVYCAGQTLFCWAFNLSTFSNRSATRHGLMIIQSVNISILFFFLADEAMDDYVHFTSGSFDDDLNAMVNRCLNGSNSSMSPEFTSCIIRNNSGLAWYNEGTAAIRSFRIEFALLTGECLAHFFSTCSTLQKRCPATGSAAPCEVEDECASGNHPDEQSLGIRRPLSTARERGSASSGYVQTSTDTTPLLLNLTNTSSLITRALVSAVILLNITLLVSVFFFRFMLHYLCIYLSVVMLTTGLGYHVSRNFRVRHQASFTGFDRLFLLSSSASFASNLLALSAIIGTSRQITGLSVDAVDYAVCTLYVVLAYIQVVFVLYCARVEPDARHAGYNLIYFRGIVLCLAISNGFLWFKTTFLDRYSHEEKNDKLLRHAFGIYVWAVLKNVLRPVEHFFLFNSCLLLVKVYCRLQPRQQRSQGP